MPLQEKPSLLITHCSQQSHPWESFCRELQRLWNGTHSPSFPKSVHPLYISSIQYGKLPTIKILDHDMYVLCPVLVILFGEKSTTGKYSIIFQYIPLHICNMHVWALLTLSHIVLMLSTSLLIDLSSQFVAMSWVSFFIPPDIVPARSLKLIHKSYHNFLAF